MKQDNLHTGEVARKKLMDGVKKCSDAVAVTMGTAGSNSLIECIEKPGHYSTNDGATILETIKLSDEIEEMGRQILNEAVSRANKSSGDGSSTACVLTASLLEEGMKYIEKSVPMEIKNSIEKCLPKIEDLLDKQKKEISVKEVKQVASISAESEKIGEKIQEIYEKIGKNGIIQWDISKTAEDYYTIGTGLEINGATYASPYMADMISPTSFSQVANIKNPLVLLLRQKITTGADFGELFKSLNNNNTKEIVIFCDDIEVPAIVHFILTQQQRGFRTLVVKMPTLWKDEWWEDLSIASGAKIIDALSGIKITDIKEEHLGKFDNIKVTKESTFIDGIKDMSLHIANLIASGEEKDLLRASRLNTKTARYYVGAISETALAYKRLKVEDAINAASCALENGIVAGGGIALLNVSKELKGKTIGEKILKKVLLRPFEQIIKNAGINKEVIDEVGGNIGINSENGKKVDLLEKGIVDPVDIVKNAIKNAIGVASSILTTETIITLPKEKND